VSSRIHGAGCTCESGSAGPLQGKMITIKDSIAVAVVPMSNGIATPPKFNASMWWKASWIPSWDGIDCSISDELLTPDVSPDVNAYSQYLAFRITQTSQTGIVTCICVEECIQVVSTTSIHWICNRKPWKRTLLPWNL
jgi:hypothetical protein